MLKRSGVLLLGTIVAAMALIGGAGAVVQPQSITSPAIDLSTRSSVVKYLSSLGIDSKRIVIQRGARNYAGPHCPGKGWTCTTAKRVVQISFAMNVTQFQCTPSTGGGPSLRTTA